MAARPALAPCTSVIARARLIATTGEPASANRASYSCTTSAHSIRVKQGRRRCRWGTLVRGVHTLRKHPRRKRTGATSGATTGEYWRAAGRVDTGTSWLRRRKEPQSVGTNPRAGRIIWQGVGYVFRWLWDPAHLRRTILHERL